MSPQPGNHSAPTGHSEQEPSGWVTRFAPFVAAGARVLDLASGHGRHARYFARRGAQVLAVDRDPDALASLRGEAGVEVLAADLEGEAWPFTHASFDAIVVVHYLHRPRLDALMSTLAPGGTLIYETFAVGNERFGRPSNPAFLLRRGELLELVREKLKVVAFEEGIAGSPRPAVVQRIVAVDDAAAWPLALARADAR